ncbi:MAG: outer membrane protein assembly factor BamC [Pseudomonadales bacterium]|nr:outer membrane protein assembly factor BamC [Pseudomonadales bacterium]MCP5171852.1 outer membrane protein assembly factor BamC [Pseudomonadales bacterium]
MSRSITKWHRVPVLVGILAMSGCGDLIRDRSSDYLKSEEIPPMTLPDGVDASVIGQIYVIPDIASTEVSAESNVLPRPRPLSETRFEETVKIQSYENSAWILINRPPEEVWPRVRNILSRNGVPTTSVDAASGIMETSWVQFKDDDKNSHRFRLRVEPAVQINSTEVKLTHTQVAVGSEEAAASWPEVSQDKEREKQMLEIVANMMASDISSGTISLLAQSIGGEAKVEMVTPQVADPFLKLKLNYDRSWASVIYSLSRGGFSVTDQDKTAGVVYVDYMEEAEQEEGDGFLWGLFGGKKEPEKNAYQVLVKSVEQGVEVRITGAGRESIQTSQSARLLKIIRNNLS